MNTKALTQKHEANKESVWQIYKLIALIKCHKTQNKLRACDIK